LSGNGEEAAEKRPKKGRINPADNKTIEGNRGGGRDYDMMAGWGNCRGRAAGEGKKKGTQQFESGAIRVQKNKKGGTGGHELSKLRRSGLPIKKSQRKGRKK